MADTIHFRNKWGEVLERAEGFVEIRWFDTTGDMDGSDFNEFLAAFAGVVERTGRPGCLVDALSFRMNPKRFDMGWRDKNIIPRYNAAGVKKFAFHMPEGMPAIGKPPAVEGPADFPTAYFATRVDAIEWLID